ncbi:hypothetical protein HMPREF0372_00928 [Flavonifractor plautii ATCC 29863]|uniref:Uncharacterized protein n=1 Tax=Flavonifractor plautii ATCC 29863 TaxID=411475 RepID=G9YN55_FLAPL|nr:hypothetical protein HMPREF0372_00928 [Flavonifractor plautii ATCC 29863]
MLYDMQDTPLILSSKVKIKRGQRQADLLVRNAFVLNYGKLYANRNSMSRCFCKFNSILLRH